MEKVNLPDGQKGNWKVEKFTITEDDSMMAMFRFKGRAPSPGTYTRLMCGSTVVMSDTPSEQRDHWHPIRYAKDHVLINGLGIGMVLLNCMNKPEVNKATVIELSQDVIDLVGPYYKEKYGVKLDIIQSDAMTFKPPKDAKYGMVWHDIWSHICADNYDGMKKLHRKYGRKAEWQGSWCHSEVKRLFNQPERRYW